MSTKPKYDAGEDRREPRETNDRTGEEVEKARPVSRDEGAEDGGLVAGSVEVVVASPVTAALRAKLEEALQRTDGLRLVTAGGSIVGGIRMVVFASRPLALAAALGRLPFVAEVTKQQVKKITRLQVRLAVPG